MKILVPTDFSETANHALYYAIELAKKENSILILLHALPNLIDPILQARVNKEADNQMKSAALKVKHAGGVDYECVAVKGPVTNTIIETIGEKNIELVVMGTNDETNLSRAILGSTTMRVIEKADCPVITVPASAPFGLFRTITYATDYNYSDLAALNKVLEIAKPFRAQVNVLHITGPGITEDEEKKLMKSFMGNVIEKLGYNNFSFQVLSGDNVLQELKNYLERNPADLLAMSRGEHDFFDKLFGKSLTREIAYDPKIPVMVFHHHNRLSAKETGSEKR